MSQIEKEAPMRSDAMVIATPRRPGRHVSGLLAAIAVAVGVLGWLTTAPAMASIGITSFSSSVINQDGTPATQAGSHPYESVTSFTFAADSSGLPNENVKNTIVDLPPGLIGNPNATAKCTVQQLDQNQCPGSAQIGQLTLSGNSGFGPFSFTGPVYNMVPPAGMPAQFGANVLIVNSFVDVSVIHTANPSADGGYTLRTSVNNISAGLPLTGITLTLWGVPADPSHDADRVCAGFTTPCSSSEPITPFLTTPTSCAGSLTTTLTANSWQTPNSIETRTATSPGMTGCSALQFKPSVSVQPDTTVADSPAGLSVDVHVPQAPDTPNSLATPALRTAAVTLPAGLSISPSAANGLQACSQAQMGLDNVSEPSCPDASKIGSVEIDSPIQADPLMGSIYLAEPLVNEFGSPLAIYVVAEADGVLVKLAGNVQVDSAGRLSTTFDNSPQLPFSDLKLNFFGGPGAIFATPESCGSFPVSASLTPWSGGAPVTLADSFQISSGCVTGFAPNFSAGSSNPQAGAFSPFVVSVSRGDTDQELSGLSLRLPPGELARLGGVPLCSDSQAAAGSCPAGSQVGSALTGAGPGPHPLFLPGTVSLTGPYKGAPFGLVEVVPVHAGPLNFGQVVVRQALFFDRHDAHVTVVSDPLPTSLFGIIPLRLRRVDINLNRSRFMMNPTNCSPTQVTGTLTSTAGLVATKSSRFQVGGCGDLGFSPRLTIKLAGKRGMKAGGHPTLNAVLTTPGGQANLRSVRVTLPRSLALDAKNSRNVCSVSAAAADSCPGQTIVGEATAVTPLLDQPLSGNVYLVQGLRRNGQGQQIRTLPTLLIPLRGQIALDVTARTSVSHGKLVTTFPAIPDAPISKFTLTINGGRGGLLAVTHNLCSATQHASAREAGQNGKATAARLRLRTQCPAHHRSKKKHRK